MSVSGGIPVSFVVFVIDSGLLAEVLEMTGRDGLCQYWPRGMPVFDDLVDDCSGKLSNHELLACR